MKLKRATLIISLCVNVWLRNCGPQHLCGIRLTQTSLQVKHIPHGTRTSQLNLIYYSTLCAGSAPSTFTSQDLSPPAFLCGIVLPVLYGFSPGTS